MSLVLLRFLLRRHAASTVLCLLPPVFLGLLFGLLYPRYQQRADALRAVIPPFVKDWLAAPGLDLFAPSGFFQIPFSHPFTLGAFALCVALPTLALPAGERGRGSLDLLLSTPLERGPMVATVFALVLLQSLVLCWMPLVGGVAGAALSHVLPEIALFDYLRVSVNAFFLLAWLGSVALAGSVVRADRGGATRVYLLVVFAGVLLELTARVWERGGWLSWITPFGYYQPAKIVAGQGILGACLVLAGTAAPVLVFALRWEAGARRA